MIARPTARPAREKRCLLQNDGAPGAGSTGLASDDVRVFDSTCAGVGGALSSTAILLDAVHQSNHFLRITTLADWMLSVLSDLLKIFLEQIQSSCTTLQVA